MAGPETVTPPPAARPLGCGGIRSGISFAQHTRGMERAWPRGAVGRNDFWKWPLITSSGTVGLTCRVQSCLPTLHPGCARKAPKSRV